MRKIPFAGIELTSQRVRRLRGNKHYSVAVTRGTITCCTSSHLFIAISAPGTKSTLYNAPPPSNSILRALKSDISGFWRLISFLSVKNIVFLVFAGGLPQKHSYTVILYTYIIDAM